MIAPDHPGLPRPAAPLKFEERRSPSRASRIFLWVFSIVMIITAGTAFIFKLIEFTLSFTSHESIRFAIIPLLTYLIVASGYGCLFIWSYLKGHYRDVEAPKYRMLVMQDEIDRAENHRTSRDTPRQGN